MAVQAALDFFHLARQRPDVRERIAAWGPAAPLSELIELAGQLGYVFTEAELQVAFRHDWAMRWLHHTSAR